MEEKEMIEEMAEELSHDIFEDENETIMELSRHLVAKGYRKIPKDSVVLSKEEKQKLLKEMYEQGKFDALADLEKDGKVVLDRQEHQKYCAYKIIEPQIRGCFDRERELEKQVAELEEQRDRQAYITEHLKDCIESNQVVEEMTRKETAKEILQSLLDFVNCEKINQGHSFEKIKETLIKVAKTYEVKVEE